MLHRRTGSHRCAPSPAPGGRSLPPPPSSHIDAAPPPQAPIDAAPDAQPPLATEAEARALLARQFRLAGFRIREDVTITAPRFHVTLDGLDPARGVGYEYIASNEIDSDLTAQEARALAADERSLVLVLLPVDPVQLQRRAAAFLAQVPADG